MRLGKRSSFLSSLKCLVIVLLVGVRNSGDLTFPKKNFLLPMTSSSFKLRIRCEISESNDCVTHNIVPVKIYVESLIE